ncbi:MAG: CPBP family intramembrane metalloprotease [Chloroflexi bacterium]|nr:CPBP family intramembrane metalloprotease [Chloroflexota bacterium]
MSLPALPTAQMAQPPESATLDHGPALHWADWIVRLALWAAMVVTFAQQLGGQLADSEVLLPLLLFAALMAGYLLASVAPVARRIHQWSEAEPLMAAVIPLFLLSPYVLYGRLAGTFEASDLLTSGVLLFLPAALALINTASLRPADISLGLIAVAMPLLLPLTRNQPIESTDAILRLVAFLMPVLLLLLTTRQQKQRLNFLFLCAVLSLWYSVEFNAFPDFVLPGQLDGMTYFQLAALPTFLYILTVSGRFGGLGLSFTPSPRGLSIVASNLALFTLIAVPLGLLTHFIVPGFQGLPVADVLARAVTIFLFIALPEEILFRGTLFHYLRETMRWPEAVTVGVSSLVFGAAHLNNPPNIGWYFVLAVIAGVFYARTYLATRNVGAAATLHTAVDWVWGLIFTGGLQ